MRGGGQLPRSPGRRARWPSSSCCWSSQPASPWVKVVAATRPIDVSDGDDPVVFLVRPGAQNWLLALERHIDEAAVQ